MTLLNVNSPLRLRTMRKVEKVSRTEVKYLPTLHEKLKKKLLRKCIEKGRFRL
jgi:hypothetical protein